MKHRITVETAILIIKYGVSQISCWPLPAGSSTVVILQHNLYFWIVMANLLLATTASVNNIIEHRHDVGKIIRIGAEAGAVIAVIAKMFICKMEAPRIQALVAEMEAFLKQANREEREVIQSYIDRTFVIHALVFCSIIFGPITFISTPMITLQPFPGDASYPFPVDSYWLWATLYMLQSICIIHVGCSVLVDMFLASLLWYAGARFRILASKFRKATNANDIIDCIQQHEELIEYVNRLIIFARILAVEVVLVAMYAVTLGGFILIGNPPIYEFAKFVFFEIASALELFLLTWPADNLIDVSNGIADAAYDCDWNGKSPVMLKNILIVIQRSLNPIKISVGGLLPVLSLEFYASTMAATFSYLTTLHAMFAE